MHILKILIPKNNRQLRIVALSSLHSQNEALSEFLSNEPDLPVKVASSGNTRFLSDIKINRLSLSKKALEAVPNTEDSLEAHLLQSTSSMTDNLRCPVTSSSPFLLRALPILWRQMVFGHGEPSLVWSNPGSLIPLRLHSFASILHLLGGTCLYLSKSNVTEVDGVRKWTMACLARVVALLFDEKKLFGDQSKEAVDRENWSLILHSGNNHAGISTTQSRTRRGRHVRSRLDLSQRGSEGDPTLEVRENDILSTVAGALAGPLRGMHKRDNSIESFKPNASEASDGIDTRVDSKVDFQNALRASLAEYTEEDFDRVQSTTTSGTSATMMQALSSLSGNGNPRFMSMPASRTLTTISETDDGEDDTADFEGNAHDSDIDDAVVIETSHTLGNDSAVKKQARGVRQMRIPVRRIPKQNIVEVETDTLDGPDFTNNFLPPVDRISTSATLPPSDDDLEKLKIGFLDAIEENRGMR